MKPPARPLAALLLLLAARAHAACGPAPNDQELLEYACEGGSAQDLQQVPPQVEKIRIAHMPLERITEATFARFAQTLLVLTCSHCRVAEIEDGAFRRLENLQQLSLDNNLLTEVRAAWFENLASLTYLDLNYNRIARVEPGVFANAPSLVDLRISGNRLQCLDVAGLSRLQGLQRIFLNDNPDFACPNAVKRFLRERHVEFEADPEWSAVQQDRQDAGEPGPPATEPTTTPPVYRTRATATKPSVTPEPATTPATTPAPPPPTPPPTPRRQQIYVPEMIQPSVVDQDFAYQGPYYAPKVTQPPDNYRNSPRNESAAPEAAATTTPKVLVAGLGAEDSASSTECPTGGAGLPAAESLLLGLALAAALARSVVE